MAGSPWRGGRKHLEELFQQAHVSWRVGQFGVLALASALVLGLAGAWPFGWVGAALGSLLGGCWPFVFLHGKARRRQRKLLGQLPNAFLLMARVIRAGQSVPQAMQAVAEAPDDDHLQLVAGRVFRHRDPDERL